MMETWKEFEKNPATHSMAHHLLAVDDHIKERGYARVTDIARQLNISRGSASLSIKALKEKGFIEEDDNRFLKLSAKSKALVKAIRQNHETALQFLTEILNVSKEQAEIDACKIEHLLSSETTDRLAAFMNCIGENENVLNQCLDGNKSLK
ncbi:MAG: winged helix-turn-helix transcriptional regulator [Caldithrix sp.]|nr:winged helix-turn-helix transcriptional regulator [Caldithrix sp.]